MENLLQAIENARARKTFASGLGSYTQANCQVTLTDNGLRIYRPPNLIHDSSTMHNMWGGMKLVPYNIANKDVLIQGHTYIVKFHVRGQSTNAATTVGFTNNMGWSGGGLVPAPSNVSYQYTPANFNGEMDCFYKFTCNDSIWKTCTTSYSSFVAGTSYQSYRDFQFGFNYNNTGALGTDLYITNIRMYDLTNGGQNISVLKNGIIKSIMNENSDYKTAKFSKDGDIISNEFYEL